MSSNSRPPPLFFSRSYIHIVCNITEVNDTSLWLRNCKLQTLEKVAHHSSILKSIITYSERTAKPRKKKKKAKKAAASLPSAQEDIAPKRAPDDLATRVEPYLARYHRNDTRTYALLSFSLTVTPPLMFLKTQSCKK